MGILPRWPHVQEIGDWWNTRKFNQFSWVVQQDELIGYLDLAKTLIHEVLEFMKIKLRQSAETNSFCKRKL